MSAPRKPTVKPFARRSFVARELIMASMMRFNRGTRQITAQATAMPVPAKRAHRAEDDERG